MVVTGVYDMKKNRKPSVAGVGAVQGLKKNDKDENGDLQFGSDAVQERLNNIFKQQTNVQGP